MGETQWRRSEDKMAKERFFDFATSPSASSLLRVIATSPSHLRHCANLAQNTNKDPCCKFYINQKEYYENNNWWSGIISYDTPNGRRYQADRHARNASKKNWYANTRVLFSNEFLQSNTNVLIKKALKTGFKRTIVDLMIKSVPGYLNTRLIHNQLFVNKN